ncbi:hypothetical protein BDV39DRAFT_181679 [Aspergillus sergii]|uniref:Uncharacterized protein n=1 Tax=Aspergillus sergii TaxID=1034303 RepID=A0A5N6WSU8_9EURO|nr:hypothetical protein BDV39DRAFT_181679 [Aspergillus sergii]
MIFRVFPTRNARLAAPRGHRRALVAKSFALSRTPNMWAILPCRYGPASWKVDNNIVHDHVYSNLSMNGSGWHQPGLA